MSEKLTFKEMLRDHQTDETQPLVEQLIHLCSSENIEISQDQAERCISHLLYVLDVNRYVNLTRITHLDDALILHIFDSLLLHKYLPQSSTQFLDMGSGAGFPGIPLSIVRGGTWMLLDSVGKKVDALNTFVAALGLSHVRGVHDRIEVYAQDHADRFNTVVARALAPLPVLIEYAAPFISRGGHLVVTKGAPDSTELQSGKSVATMCGFELVNTIEFELPHSCGHRTILDYQHTKSAQIKLPREIGLAKRKPLA